MTYGNSFANCLEQYEDPRAPAGVLLRIAGGIKMSMR